MRCVRCMSEDVSVRKFTDSANAGVVSVIATIQIPVCAACHKASKPWWIGFAILLTVFFISGIPFAIAQDKHVAIPKIIPILMFLPLVGAILCSFTACRRAPVRLVPNKIDRENLRIKFFNKAYAEVFLEANKATSKIINPWKWG